MGSPCPLARPDSGCWLTLTRPGHAGADGRVSLTPPGSEAAGRLDDESGREGGVHTWWWGAYGHMVARDRLTAGLKL